MIAASKAVGKISLRVQNAIAYCGAEKMCILPNFNSAACTWLIESRFVLSRVRRLLLRLQV